MKRRNRPPSSRPSTLADITARNVHLIAALEAAGDDARTLAERVADRVTAVVGSWTFLVIQTVLLGIWMVLNLLAWSSHWDPYPFVLLNLVLSFQAAFATPVILMSQNRQARMADRRNELDLQINLLAEQETTEQLRLLRLLCEKLDVRIESETVRALEENVEPEAIVEQIIDHMERGRVTGQTT